MSELQRLLRTADRRAFPPAAVCASCRKGVVWRRLYVLAELNEGVCDEIDLVGRLGEDLGVIRSALRKLRRRNLVRYTRQTGNYRISREGILEIEEREEVDARVRAGLSGRIRVSRRLRGELAA